jgi:peptidoglycan-associated lipoprotein
MTGAARAPVEPIPNLSVGDAADTERLNSGIAVAKNDPATTRRQLQEARAEQAATAAAGLRDVFFGYDSWQISDEGRQALSRNAEWLRMHPAVQLKVEGHCDERGSSTYNFVLAEKRAKVILNYLSDLGIRRERLVAVSYGKERPFCNDRTEACYQQNRRGHLVVRQ